EYDALARTLGERGGALMFIPALSSPGETTRDVERVGTFCAPHGVAATWSPLVVMRQNPQAAIDLLEHSRDLHARGVKMYPQVSTRSYDVSINFDSTMMFFEMPHWNEAVQASRAEKLQMLSDPGWRAASRAEWDHDRGVFFPTHEAGQAR